MTRLKPSPPPGLLVRRRAADAMEAVLVRRRPLNEALALGADLDAQDRAFLRKLVATTLRRLGSIDALLAGRLRKPLPDGLPRVTMALRLGLCQLLFLDVPDHAAVDTTVRLVEADRKAIGFVPLVNGVLRGIARDREAALAGLDPLDDLPPFWRARWVDRLGEDTARKIAAIQAVEPPLDLTVKADPAAWAERLGGRVTPTGSVRLVEAGAVPTLTGFAAGEWWVQDAAAAIPARLLGPVAGKRVLDLCAAPGGKTAQLATSGAHVTALDRSRPRMARLIENLTRLGLSAETMIADAATFEGRFQAVLIDAPCTATGTARGDPDVPHLKGPHDLAQLVALQARLLDRLADLLEPGGVAVYCTCSLEPEEGEDQISAILARESRLRLDPISDDDLPGLSGLVAAEGFLRTLPSHWPDADARWTGLDGFFAARLVRS